MRLTCPNCAAQYEVDPEVIPEEGRDVQCSNCGHIWFQRRDGDTALAPEQPVDEADEAPADHDAAPDEAYAGQGYEEDAEPAAGEAPAMPAQAEPTRAPAMAEATSAGAQAAPDIAEAVRATVGDWEETRPTDEQRRPAPAHVADEDEWEEEEEEPQPAPAAAGSQRAALDEDILRVLREEAERESHARRSEAGTIETQADLGIESAPPAPAPAPETARERIAMMRGVEPDDLDAAEARAEPSELQPRPRRESLPDIEEIRSTLDEAAGTAPSEAMVAAEAGRTYARRRGFRAGFLLMILVVAAIILLYTYAPVISASYPPLAEPMAAFVATVDNARVWIDAAAISASDAIMKLAEGEG